MRLVKLVSNLSTRIGLESLFFREHFEGEHFFEGSIFFGRILMESILTGSILFLGAFGGELLFGEHLIPNENYDMNGLKL